MASCAACAVHIRIGYCAGAPGQGGPQQQPSSLPPPPPPPSQQHGQFSDAPAALPPPPPPPPAAPAGGTAGYPVQLLGAPVSLPSPSSAAVAAVAAAAAALRGKQPPPPPQSPPQQKPQQQQQQPSIDQGGPVSRLVAVVFECGSQSNVGVCVCIALDLHAVQQAPPGLSVAGCRR